MGEDGQKTCMSTCVLNVFQLLHATKKNFLAAVVNGLIVSKEDGPKDNASEVEVLLELDDSAVTELHRLLKQAGLE